MAVEGSELDAATQAAIDEGVNAAALALLQNPSDKEMFLLVDAASAFLEQSPASRSKLPVSEADLNAWRANLPHA